MTDRFNALLAGLSTEDYQTVLGAIAHDIKVATAAERERYERDLALARRTAFDAGTIAERERSARLANDQHRIEMGLRAALVSLQEQMAQDVAAERERNAVRCDSLALALRITGGGFVGWDPRQREAGKTAAEWLASEIRKGEP